ncbi:uncharacterized protein CXQ87_004391 [Candidozyma duobushaemuli]|nr:uncharacterized protein CXQ87_004391 [[Candida] duobushaemulonis]PVH16835.1 hypothetical protein CXQ87_004391 [[Candida] duobushaemulonis]
MHPQLDRNRFDSCEKLMDALEECHKAEFLKKAMGMCNFEKDELTKCLHVQRTEDAKQRIIQSREKQKAFHEQQRKREEELYGKNGYLKKVIEMEASKRH